MVNMLMRNIAARLFFATACVPCQRTVIVECREKGGEAQRAIGAQKRGAESGTHATWRERLAGIY
jgi:hypothetical protein